MDKSLQKILDQIPDLSSWEEAMKWVNEGQKKVEIISGQVSEAEIFSIEWKDVQEKTDPLFGLYSSLNWRKFALATFLADLVSYPTPSDQVNFDRLLFVMHSFPQGFRTWWLKFPDQLFWPVGYTGWYPMLETQFNLFKNQPEKLKDRMVPIYRNANERPFLYLFNFSVAPALKKTKLSNKLIKSFVNDIEKEQAKGLACITVSEEGVKIAHRFGMTCTGSIQAGGDPEGVYVRAHPS